MDRVVKWNFNRRFGIEYEFDRGASTRAIARVLQHNGYNCTERPWEHTRNNDCWVAKTDSSCGYELNTPIMSGWRDLKAASEVLTFLREAGINYNTHCGNHVHVEIRDFNLEQAKILAAYWIKIERFVMNGTPDERQNNGYCRLMENITRGFRPNQNYSLDDVWYYCTGRDAINFSNYRSDRLGNRGTVEFRFGEMTHDPEVIKNRVRFLIWFVEMCKILPAPDNLNWYTPKQVLKMFGLLQRPNSPIKLHFSPAVQSMRKWLLQRLIALASDVYSKDREMCERLLAEINEEESLIALASEEDGE